MSLHYKFLNQDSGLKVLESARLKVSTLSELNDIFDCSPLIQAPSDQPTYTDETWTKHVITQNTQNTGLLCLSLNHVSPLMWGHYADSAKGLALGFDPDEMPWKNPSVVQYKEERPRFKWASDDEIDKGFVDRMQESLYGVKALEWKYEQEIRHLLVLSSCLPHEGMYFAPFPRKALREILLGQRCKLDAIWLSRFLKCHFPGMEIAIRRAVPHPTRYEMTMETASLV